LDGRLYWQQSKEDGGELQLLDLTISSLMNHPVRTCAPPNDENSENTNETADCGIFDGIRITRLLALNEHGRLYGFRMVPSLAEQYYESRTNIKSKGQPDQTVLLQRKDYCVAGQ
jgi:hypothetical protein